LFRNLPVILGEFVPLLGDTSSPNNEQQSLTQSQLLVSSVVYPILQTLSSYAMQTTQIFFNRPPTKPTAPQSAGHGFLL
jgi:hypothetical protein